MKTPSAHPSSKGSKNPTGRHAMGLKNSERFQEIIRNRSARIGVIGLGYVGLPLAVAFAEAGFHVFGFDRDGNKCRQINKGASYVRDVSSDRVRGVVTAKRFRASNHDDVLQRMDIVLICVPTPLGKTKDPDISYIVSAVDHLEAYFQKNQLLVLESTSYPGTTREIVLPRLTRRGWKPGMDFFLGFSPERTDPGNPVFGLMNTPKIVSGLTPSCLTLVGELYKTVAKKVVPVSSMEVAEMAKLLENTFRAVNIALVNEVAQMCEKLQLNVWEVIDAAGTKPFGYMKFYPGPGIGGHCIPLDPHYLSWKLKLLNFHSRFIDLAEDVNSYMPRYVVQRAAKELNARRRSVSGSSVLVLGVAYKKDISDTRESPALEIMEELIEQGAMVSYVDPHVPCVKVGGREIRSKPLTQKVLESADIVLLVTDHRAFDMDYITRHSSLLFDTRNAVTKGGIRGRVVVL